MLLYYGAEHLLVVDGFHTILNIPSTIIAMVFDPAKYFRGPHIVFPTLFLSIKTMYTIKVFEN
jgi:hypothetical protein